MPQHLAIIDDDPAFGGQLARYLSRHGLQVEVHPDSASFFATIPSGLPSLVLLDQVLGAESGLSVLHRLRAISHSVPCIILTGLGDEVDRVVGLESGADDYISKAVMPREILARIRAVMRRSAPVATPLAPEPPAGPPAAGRWRFCPSLRTLTRPDGSPVTLTTAEFELLRALHAAQGQPLSREGLCATVLGRPYRPEDRSIDNLVAKLRRKIEPDPLSPSIIKSVRPLGYVFTAFPGDAEPPLLS